MIKKGKINSIIEERKNELFNILCNLIKINSENFGSHGNEKECAEYIAAYFDELGFETDLYSPLDIENFEEHPDYFSGRGLENRYNVTVRYKGAEDKDSLMLMAHSDTEVIGDTKKWSIPPLCGKIKEGKVWGRGACDDKYAVATAMFLIKLFNEEGFMPRENILFTAYCDEEKGGSNGSLASCIKYPCARTINMDCKSFELWNCASGGGICAYRYNTQRPTDSAYLAAAAIPVVMETLKSFGERRSEELKNNKYFKDTVIPYTTLRYMGVKAGDNGADLGCGEVSFNYYTDKTKEEIFAELCEMEKELSQKLSKIGIEGEGFTHITRFFHYGSTDSESEFIKDIQSAARDASDRNVKPCGSCISDLSIIQKYCGGEAVAFGIGRAFDDYGGAHQPDEHIDCDSLVEYAKIIAHYIFDTQSR